MARTRYPCEGCITIRFLAKKGVTNVLYKHHAIHRSPYDKIEDPEEATEQPGQEGQVERPKEPVPGESESPTALQGIYNEWETKTAPAG